MGHIRARSLKRTSARLSDLQENLPLANEKLSRGTLSSEDDELRLSVHKACLWANFSLLSTFCTLKRPSARLSEQLISMSVLKASLKANWLAAHWYLHA